MTAQEKQRFYRIEALFDAALDRPPSARDAWLREQTAGDPDLLDSIRRLLADDIRVTSAVPPRPEPLPRFGAWQALRLLGRGGMGMVYLAERADGAFHMQAAVKVVPLALASVEIEERFRRERQFLASLDHPKIARLIDGGVTPLGLPYLVMEYIDGVPIDKYCDSFRLDARARIALVRQVLDALIYVHGRQVMHRDLKPSNILVDSAGSVKLLDFGTARLVDAGGDTAITRTGVFAFTPECASPEQVQARPITSATDIYSTGVLLYRLLTGRPPYRLDNRSTGAVADTVSHTPPDPSGLEAALDAIVSTALRKDPAARYRSAADLDADLARYLGGEAVQARVLPKPRLYALVSIALVALLAAAGWFALHKPAPPSNTNPRYVLSTVAGVGRLPFAGSGSPALHANFVWPHNLAADSSGNIFIGEPYYNQVLRISPAGIITVYAGTGQPGFSGDNGRATAARFNNPLGVAADLAGNLFIMDNGNARLRKVSPAGIVTTVARVVGAFLAMSPAGDIYVGQAVANVIHKVSPNGVVTTFAGSGQAGSAGDGGPAEAAQFNAPAGIACDAAGNLYVADTNNHKIRRITPHGIVSTFAGNGKSGFGGDGRAAVHASLRAPLDVAAAPDGSIYIADDGNGRVRVVSPRGIISTFAGGPAAQALRGPGALALAPDGSLVVADREDRRLLRVTGLATTTIAGAPPRDEPDAVRLLKPYGVAIDDRGVIYVSDISDRRIRKITPAGIVATIGIEDGRPQALAVDRAGSVYFADASRVRRIAPDGTVSTVAGGAPGFSGDNGPAAVARLSSPSGLAVDPRGNLYIADTNNNRIRRIDAATLIIGTIAGNGKETCDGDNGPAAAATLAHPGQLAFDGSGNLYIADTNNNRIRKVSPDGTISTVAGNGIRGDWGDGGDSTAAQLIQPTGLAVDAAGNLYIASRYGTRIRMVDAATQRITTIAVLAAIDSPEALALDGHGNLYFVDSKSLRLRKLAPAR